MKRVKNKNSVSNGELVQTKKMIIQTEDKCWDLEPDTNPFQAERERTFCSERERAFRYYFLEEKNPSTAGQMVI